MALAVGRRVGPAPAEVKAVFLRIADRPMAHAVREVEKLKAAFGRRFIKSRQGAERYDGRRFKLLRLRRWFRSGVGEGATLRLRGPRREKRDVRARARGPNARRGRAAREP